MVVGSPVLESAEPLDLEPDIPSSVLGHACYLDKCVWATRVLPVHAVALKLWYRDFFGFSSLGLTAPPGEAQRLTREIRAWARRYLALRARGLTAEEAQSVAPPPVRRLVNRLIERAEFIYAKAQRLVEERIKRVPETGWRVLTDESRARHVLVVSPRHAERLLGDIRAQALRSTVKVAFCNETACYPVYKGLYPTKHTLALAYILVRRDVPSLLTRMYGASSFWEYIDVVAKPGEAAITVYPGRRATKLNLFLRVENPAEHTIRLSMLQRSAEKASELLMKLSANYAEKGSAEPGALPLSLEEVEKAIKDYLEEKEKKRKKKQS